MRPTGNQPSSGWTSWNSEPHLVRRAHKHLTQTPTRPPLRDPIQPGGGWVGWGWGWGWGVGGGTHSASLSLSQETSLQKSLCQTNFPPLLCWCVHAALQSSMELFLPQPSRTPSFSLGAMACYSPCRSLACLQMAEPSLYLLSIISFRLSLHCLSPLAYQSVSAHHCHIFFQAP